MATPGWREAGEQQARTMVVFYSVTISLCSFETSEATSLASLR